MRIASNSRLGIVLLGAYVVLYAATLYAMVRFGGFDAGEALGVFAVLGVGFSLLAWLLTLGVKPLPYHVREPGRELRPAVALHASVGGVHRLRLRCDSPLGSG